MRGEDKYFTVHSPTGTEKPKKMGTYDALLHILTESPLFSHPAEVEHSMEVKVLGSESGRYGQGLWLCNLG